jgi:hypothetical protein
VWSIATATGWSVRHILWELSFAALLVMIADAPRYVGSRKRKIDSEDELKKFLF